MRPARSSGRSGKYISPTHSARPICVGLMTDNPHGRQFFRELLRAHDYLVPRREPTADSNELFDLVLALRPRASIDEFARLEAALEVPVLAAPARDFACTELEFPCKFDQLEDQILRSLGRDIPPRTDIHPDLGVNLERLLSAFTPSEAALFGVLHRYAGAVVPDAVLVEEGFGAIIERDSRDRGVRRFRKLLRLIGLEAERSRRGLWCLVIPPR